MMKFIVYKLYPFSIKISNKATTFTEVFFIMRSKTKKMPLCRLETSFKKLNEISLVKI